MTQTCEIDGFIAKMREAVTMINAIHKEVVAVEVARKRMEMYLNVLRRTMVELRKLRGGSE